MTPEEFEKHVQEVGAREKKEASEDLSIERAVRSRLYKILLAGECSDGIYASAVQAWVAFEAMMSTDTEVAEAREVYGMKQQLSFDEEIDRFLMIQEKLAKLGRPATTFTPPVEARGVGQLPQERVVPQKGNIEELERERREAQRNATPAPVRRTGPIVMRRNTELGEAEIEVEFE